MLCKLSQTRSGVLQVVQCERLAGGDRRIGPVCKLCGPQGTVAMDAVQQRRNYAFGEDAPVAAVAVHRWELAVSEIVHERRPREVRILLWREDAVTIAYANRATHLPG